MSAQPRHPAGLRLIIAFLLVDGAVRVAVLLHSWFVRSPGETQALVQDTYHNVILVVFYLLLAVQLLLRTPAGRLWGTIFFGVHILVELFRYTVLQPEHWAYLGLTRRLQVLLTESIFACFIVLLNTKRVREACRDIPQ